MPEPADPDPLRRFTERADDYRRYRPDYPDAAIDELLDGLSAARLVAADVGAGTGIAARQLAQRGVRVLAVEPNAAMRRGATAHARVHWLAGTAEATGLAAGAVDLVLCAQAFHWFDVAAATAEFQRILRHRGRLALMWNKRSSADDFTAAYRAALRDADAEPPPERSAFDARVVDATGRFTNLRHHVCAHRHRLTLAALRGRALSTSTVPRAGPALAALLRRLEGLHAQFADAQGCVTMVYDTHTFTWDRAGPMDSAARA